ncbi:DNA polymerase III subunit gamma/tau [Candidatus Marinimicrobia bacterium MT.SAG.2]|nr:DNA polymerase III subunit gamma/tau [Candidatus Marinimicrobia bacterium MT.SAG.2]
MSYLVLSRKYRPQQFQEIVGQSHVTKTLQNALLLDRLSHAYILSGPRGVGKTTTARILAKALNCLEGTKSEPCGVCGICNEITEGRSLDVLEIDGATYRGIDKIRDDLQDYLRHPPMKTLYKVVIIDEVHMLTKEAFNALLKTLEEPPPNVVFIFATTQPNKVPPTILSRCQRFDFKRILGSEIIKSLAEIMKKEKIDIDEDSLLLIAKKADGGMRDALSLLDQVISFTDGSVNFSSVRSILSVVDEEIFFSITDLAMTGNSLKGLEIVDDLMSQGYDPETLISGLLEHLRSLLIVTVTNSADLIETTKDIKKLYLAQKDRFAQSELHRISKLTEDALLSIPRSSMTRMIFESLLLKISNMDKSVEIESLLNGMGYSVEGTDSENEKKSSSIKDKSKSASNSDSEKAVAAAAKEVSDKKDDSQSQSKNSASITLEELKEKWDSIIFEISKTRNNLGNALQKSHLTGLTGNYLELSFDSDDQYQKGAVDHNSEYIRNYLKENIGIDIMLKTVSGEFNSVKNHSTEEIIEDEKETISEQDMLKHPTVEKIMEKFNGKLAL